MFREILHKILEALMRRQSILRNYKISNVKLQTQVVLGSIICQKLVCANIDCFSFNVQDKTVFWCVKHFEVNAAAGVNFCFKFHCFRNIHRSSSQTGCINAWMSNWTLPSKLNYWWEKTKKATWFILFILSIAVNSLNAKV